MVGFASSGTVAIWLVICAGAVAAAWRRASQAKRAGRSAAAGVAFGAAGGAVSVVMLIPGIFLLVFGYPFVGLALEAVSHGSGGQFFALVIFIVFVVPMFSAGLLLVAGALGVGWLAGRRRRSAPPPPVPVALPLAPPPPPPPPPPPAATASGSVVPRRRERPLRAAGH